MADSKEKKQLGKRAIKKIETLYTQGKSMSEISKIMGIKQSQVSYHLKRSGVAKNLIDCKCVTCIYGTAKGYCMYILATGHKRPSVSGNECTQYVEGEYIAVDKTYDPIVCKEKVTLKDCYSQAIIEY